MHLAHISDSLAQGSLGRSRISFPTTVCPASNGSTESVEQVATKSVGCESYYELAEPFPLAPLSTKFHLVRWQRIDNLASPRAVGGAAIKEGDASVVVLVANEPAAGLTELE